MRMFTERSKQPFENNYDELLTLVRKKKVRRFGHVSRSSGLAKTILKGTVKGKRKKRQTEEEVGRQYQRIDRNGLRQFIKGKLKAGQDGKGLLRIHLWCPDDLPRLWDRIE